ncbi:unnamed protein product [Owenia fusiformis]|uniref:Uncharacterized protein n=1 Tax=Owenia fusiformis TaxID=6347 RepID=A0A8J1U6G8_OWEFU|nr:unnamed protein product [Owenia fusiformis]
MVRILSNGEIVQDNDPRLQQRGNTNGSQQQRRGYIEHNDNEDAMMQGQGGGQRGMGYAQGPSMFDTLNQKLLNAGFPRWNAGPYVVEPLVSVGLLVLFMMAGFRGLLFGAVLFMVCKWSTSGGGGGVQDWLGGGGAAPQGPRPGGGGNPPGNRPGTGGGGNRLGR